jgi:hypothetical protein
MMSAQKLEKKERKKIDLPRDPTVPKGDEIHMSKDIFITLFISAGHNS